MELQHLERAIEDCENGLVAFSNGINLHCFLFGKTWFPVRAIVNYASQVANENKDFPKNEAINELHKLLPFVKVKTITVENNQLVQISKEEALTEIGNLADVIKSLT